MNTAYTNCIILDGTENMTPQRGKAILTEGGVITDIVPDSADSGRF